MKKSILLFVLLWGMIAFIPPLHALTAPDPSVKITSPLANATIFSDALEVNFELENFELGKDGKIKYDLNGENEKILETGTSISVSSLSAGRHKLTLTLVDMNEEELSPSISTHVVFICKKPEFSIKRPEKNAVIYQRSLKVRFQLKDFELTSTSVKSTKASADEVHITYRGGDGKIKYVLDNGKTKYHTSNDPITLTELSHGKHRLVLSLVDNDGKEIESVEKIVLDFKVVLSYKVGVELGTGIEADPGTGEHTKGIKEDFTVKFRIDPTYEATENIILLLNGEEVPASEITQEEDIYSYTLDNSDKREKHKVSIGLRSYPLTLPQQIEGVMLEPSHIRNLPYNRPFIFSLTLRDDYTESEPIVYANGKILPHNPLRALTYTYIIDNVTEAIEIKVEGIVKNTVGNTEVETQKVYASPEGLIVEIPGQSKPVSVYTLAGQLVTRKKVNNHAFITLPKGMYLVVVGETTFKIAL
ncbi:hypothetical protein D0T51_10870 [Parabacteroides sp. 52]|uniref:hypothetical protein n=1 Tax=unclassified Parabacteroides TaxID=2649774 RepID=UPI0013D15596|nr:MULTISPECIES: hypothetical protein [unclassified Parabacteroides]MDH6535188.1 hypothetical protein [Parabacteroides sp. PM5-20]NDV56227.1 hypothetical protein [Parabacteroides sp. 52]